MWAMNKLMCNSESTVSFERTLCVCECVELAQRGNYNERERRAPHSLITFTWMRVPM